MWLCGMPILRQQPKELATFLNLLSKMSTSEDPVMDSLEIIRAIPLHGEMIHQLITIFVDIPDPVMEEITKI